jgi:transketolase
VNYRDAIKEGLMEEMMRDKRVVLFGEDVADYGGAFKLSKGLLESFGRDRVFNTPISEACICGAAVGMAMAAKVDHKDYRTYTIVGDGESEEGQVWEELMFAARHDLDNLCVIFDYNGLQIDGPIADIVNPAPYEGKLSSFGFHVITINAHDFNQIENAFAEAKTVKGKPTAIVANSVKGKGVSFMENQVKWHGSAPNDAQYEQAVAEIKAQL